MDAERRAQEAAALLENEVLREALDRIERDAIEAMIAAFDGKTRRNKAEAVKAVREFRQALKLMAVKPQPQKAVV